MSAGAHPKSSWLNKVLDPHKLMPGFIGAVAAIMTFLLPPIANPQLHIAEKLLLKIVGPVAVFLVTASLAASKRTVLRVAAWAVAVVLSIVCLLSGTIWFITTSSGRQLQAEARNWRPSISDEFGAVREYKTSQANSNGEGNASTANGVLTVRLRSTHVANQQYLRFQAAASGGEYYVETQVQRQYGSVGSGCFLALGVVDSDRFFLFTVTDDEKPGAPLHSARIDQELKANPATEKPIDHTDALPYVRYWSLLYPPGSEAKWTRLAVHRVNDDYDFFVNNRLVSHTTNLPVPNETVTLGAYDPGTSDGSFVGCQFRNFRGWTREPETTPAASASAPSDGTTEEESPTTGPAQESSGATPAAPASTGPPLDPSMQVPPASDPNAQPAIPAGYSRAGPADLESYCQRYWQGRHAVLRYENAWGYRCASDPTPWPGNRVGDVYIRVDDLCVRQYGSAAIDHYEDYADPTSWGCYTPT